MARAILITGTDTGVGKTFVACGIIRSLRNKGLKVIPFKPVETGCAEIPLDAYELKKAADTDIPLNQIVPFTFKEPAAPSVCEIHEGGKINLNDIITLFNKFIRQSDIVIMEGAGGLFVPITGKFTYADLANLLDIPILVVARAKLGTINHTTMTVRLARAQGIDVMGVVINEYEGKSLAERTNPETIENLANVHILSIIPKVTKPQEAEEYFNKLAEAIICRLPK